MRSPRIALVPDTAPSWASEAVVDGGGTLVDPADAEALVWFEPGDPAALWPVLEGAPGVQWVHLPWAGIEPYVDHMTDRHVWTCGKGVYAEPVAEHALALALAGLRQLPERIYAMRWGHRGGLSLFDRKVTIIGGGGITRALLPMLAPFRCEVTVVRRQHAPVEGADRTLPVDRLHEALPGASVVFLTLALTPETTGIIGTRELELMDDDAWLVNVARGAHVVTDDLVAALEAGAIGGCALDVTEPEPLPDGHPLWAIRNAVITPHTANTLSMARSAIVERITTNVRRWSAGEELVGLVDLEAGY